MTSPPNASIKEIRLPLLGGEVYCKQWRSASGQSTTPLILLHDSLGSVGQWKDFPWLLSQQGSLPVLAYDRLGFGLSSPLQGIPPLSFVQDEARYHFPALKAALGLDKYLLLGHSVGGGMAVEIAAQDPDCLGVITLSAQAFVEERTLSGIRQAKGLFGKPGQKERLAKWHGDKVDWVLSAWMDTWLAPGFAGWNLDEALQRLACPLLAIHGSQDEYGSLAFPERMVALAQGPAQKLILDPCGHMPHKERTPEVLQAVCQFLASLPLGVEK